MIDLFVLNLVKDDSGVVQREQVPGGTTYWDNVLADMAIMPDIRHLQISYNTPCLSPNFCITFVFHFSWVLQPSQEKLKTMFMQRFFFLERGGAGAGEGQARCFVGDLQVSNDNLRSGPILSYVLPLSFRFALPAGV